MALTILLVILLSAHYSFAQLGYELNWWTVNGSGIQGLASGEFSLSGTAGQPDADMLQNGNYRLSSGFWQTSSETSRGILIFLPVTTSE